MTRRRKRCSAPLLLRRFGWSLHGRERQPQRFVRPIIRWSSLRREQRDGDGDRRGLIVLEDEPDDVLAPGVEVLTRQRLDDAHDAFGRSSLKQLRRRGFEEAAEAL